jgi:hypothetical protein
MGNIFNRAVVQTGQAASRDSLSGCAISKTSWWEFYSMKIAPKIPRC